jgi:hypothetical protein
MRIRANTVFVSSGLFTVALTCLIPTFWKNVLTARDTVWLVKLEADYRLAVQTMSDLNVVCLAVTFIALIVIWSGYRKRERWTWFVMFILVWVWAFPLLALPPLKALFEGRLSFTLPEWIHSAIYQSGLPRIWAESVLIFLLMVVALVLPIRSFFFLKEMQPPHHSLSTRLIGLSAVGVLVVTVALLTWIRVGVIYELPVSWPNSARQLPPAPAPPTWPVHKPQ